MTFQFAWPWIFFALPLPWLVWKFVKPATRRGAGAIRVPFFTTVARSGESDRRTVSTLRVSMAVVGWLLLLTSAARPQWIGELDQLTVSGRNLMLAVDISGSMGTADLAVNGKAVDRLTVVKQLGSEFLERRTGDRVALVLFGTHAYLQAPLSYDRDTVATLLSEAVVGIAGERTAIGDAIGLAIKRLREEDAEHRVLVLMTDGANTAGSVDPAEAARLAASAGLTIYTVGIGAESMAVDSLFGVRHVNPSADLDEALLEDLARQTGGRYFRAQSSEAMAGIYEVLDQIEPVPQPDRDARRVAERFHWPLAVIVIAVILSMLRAAWRGGAWSTAGAEVRDPR